MVDIGNWGYSNTHDRRLGCVAVVSCRGGVTQIVHRPTFKKYWYTVNRDDEAIEYTIHYIPQFPANERFVVTHDDQDYQNWPASLGDLPESLESTFLLVLDTQPRFPTLRAAKVAYALAVARGMKPFESLPREDRQDV